MTQGNKLVMYLEPNIFSCRVPLDVSKLVDKLGLGQLKLVDVS